ncbi:lytic transglycosylase domain-containing protein [Denitratisoma oestradiolicum]|uniref:Membrane-bound lytic murein transglycosylase F n=1 Tax=Denitratisoma oestradiolicum TaxID=311182 RepID=A0A6S6XUP5_9PROT
MASDQKAPDIYMTYSALGVPQFSSHPTQKSYRLYLKSPAGKRTPPDRNETTLAPLIQEAAYRHHMPTALLKAVIAVESGFNTRAVSAKGALGAMQVMPATGARFGVRELSDPAVNIDTGARYLALLLKRFQGNLPLALAAYNAGEGAVEDRAHRLPPYRETMLYVPAVLAKFHAYQDSEQ